MKNSRLLTPDQVAKILNIGYRNVMDMIHLGQIETIKVGRLFRIHPHVVSRFLENNKYHSSNTFKS